MTSPYDSAPATPSQVAPRPTYPQSWGSYNLAQQNEKERFLILLRDLCSTIPQPPQGRGRPRLLLSDAVFAAVYKVFSGFSSRRFTTDIRMAVEDGLLDHPLHFNSVSRYLASPALTPLLKSLIELSASPLAAVESDFAIDNTGFSTTSYDRWFDHKWGKPRVKHLWIKAHLMVGTTTNIVTAVEATASESADAPQLPDLLDTTAKTFEVREVSGDKAYNSRRNYHAIEAAGAEAYIPFKSYSKAVNKKADGLWRRMWHLYHFRQEEFAAHYHRRSNAETTMAMIKAKFGASVKSKSPTAQVNEVLAKVLAHNITVLIQSHFELGIEAVFGPQAEPAPKIIDLHEYRAGRSL